MYFEGYIDERFNSTVPEDLHCPICRNVLKEPKQCKENEHHFCEECILGHLNLSRTCPLCQDYLTTKNIKKPSRFIRNSLDNLEISCENAGCNAIVRLGDLKRHTAKCDHALVTCTNARCHMQVKRQEKKYHEEVKCKFRVLQCPDCDRLAGQVFRYRLMMFSVLVVFLGYCFECFLSVA